MSKGVSGNCTFPSESFHHTRFSSILNSSRAEQLEVICVLLGALELVAGRQSVFILPGTEGITAPPTASSRLLADVGVCVCVRGRGLRHCVSDKATPTRPCLNEITVKAVKANGKIKRELWG